jgi:Tfp pilus assembly protein PilF
MALGLMILLGGLILLAAGFVWWRQRREREYSAGERVAKIRQALRDHVDISIVYWSKSRRKILRKVVTPESLEGLMLQAFDASRKTSRTFKITRIKEIALVTDPLHFGGRSSDGLPAPVRWVIIPLLLALPVVVWLLRPSNRTTPTVPSVKSDLAEKTVGQPQPDAPSSLRLSIVSPVPQGSLRDVSGNSARAGARFEPEPADSAGYLQRAKSRFNQRDYPGAVVDCTKAIELGQFLPSAYWMRASIETVVGDFDAAILDATKTIELSPDLYQPYFVRGTARHYKGDFVAALVDLQKAVALANPKNPDPRNALAWARYRKGDWLGAIEETTKVIEMAPRNPDAYDTRGWAKLASGDKEGAVRDCAVAVELGGESHSASCSRGLLHFLDGDFGAAVADWRKAIVIMPCAKVDLEPWIIKAQQYEGK